LGKDRLAKCQIAVTSTTAQNDVIDTCCQMFAAWLALKVIIILLLFVALKLINVTLWFILIV